MYFNLKNKNKICFLITTMAMFEVTQVPNEQDQDSKDKGGFIASFYHTKNKESLTHKQFEPIADTSSQNTIQIQQNTLFDKSFASKNGNYLENNGSNTPNKKKRKKKKKVKFKDPFLDFVNVESLKEFNLRMTYIEYDDEQEVLSFHKECCSRLSKCCIF